MAKETVQSLCQKAQRAVAQGENQLARQFYQQALGLSADNPDVHYGLATVCFLLNDLPSAALHFKEVTGLDSLRAGAYINLGAVYNRLERFDEAIPVLRRGIQLDMNRAEGYYNLGVVHKRKGQPDLAIQAYHEAIRVNPRMAEAHYNIANLFKEKGQYGQAISHYRLALDIRPNWEKVERALEQAEATQEYQQEQKQRQKQAGSDEKAALCAALASSALTVDPERFIDPQAHGELLRTLHRHTIDSENQGRDVLKILLEKVEPAIKELSSCALYPDTPLIELGRCLEKFDAAWATLRGVQNAIYNSIAKIQQAGDHLLKS